MFDYRARLARPHDGDTFRVLADTGFGGRHEPDLRLAGVRAPELHEPGGSETLDWVNAWLAQASTAQPATVWPLHVRTVQTTGREPEQRRSFVRYIAHVWRADQSPAALVPGVSLNDQIIAWLARHPQWGPGRT